MAVRNKYFSNVICNPDGSKIVGVSLRCQSLDITGGMSKIRMIFI